MSTPVPPIAIVRPSIRSTLDGRFWLAAALGTAGSLLALGVIVAIIPNPLFIRMTPPDAASYAVWVVSAPLLGTLLAATFVAPRGFVVERVGEPGTGGLTLGGLGAFLAIGCPVCNKLVVLALGATGALELFAPIQPLLGLASLVVLAVSLRSALRRRAAGCRIPAG